MDLENRKVAVLGAGESGWAAARLARRRGADVSVFDSGNRDRLQAARQRFEAAGFPLVTGDEAVSPNGSFDLAILSPGIDLKWPIAHAFANASRELIGEVEFADRLSDIPVIAITGTNGKTTTTSLVCSMLQSAGIAAVAAGNIGLAYSEVILRGEPLDWVVLEVSSFQLESIVDFSPAISIWMNFAPDHMDRYATVEEYREAKRNLFRNAGPSATVIRKLEDEAWEGAAVTFSAFSPGGAFSYEDGVIFHAATERRFSFRECELEGKHNAENVMVALAVADELELSWNSVAGAVEKFRSPAHRCEKVGERDGVIFINDSKSTNLHSLESALAGQEGTVVLIVGGKEKGLDFGELLPLLDSRVRHAVCIGEIGPAIASLWSERTGTSVAASVEEAVSQAFHKSVSGDAVLFSPGTSSFDMFAGYEERGDAFREAAAALCSSSQNNQKQRQQQ